MQPGTCGCLAARDSLLAGSIRNYSTTFGNLFPARPSTEMAASQATGSGAEDRAPPMRAASMARRERRRPPTFLAAGGALPVSQTRPGTSGCLVAREWTRRGRLVCSTTSGSTTSPAASGRGSLEVISLIRTAFTEPKARQRQATPLAGVRLRSFGSMLPEQYGSLAVLASIRQEQGRHKGQPSTICGTSPVGSGLGSLAAIQLTRTARMGLKPRQQLGMFLDPAGARWGG